MKEPTPFGLSVRTAAIMIAFTLVFTAMMAATFKSTQPSIQRSAEAEKMRLINEVLPAGDYDNALLQDAIKLGPTPELGLDDGGYVWRARKAGNPVAVVMEAVAPDGYAGSIHLIVGVRTDGSVSGVRVTEQHETPGLGDYIDPRKDRNKAHPWIAQFNGKSLASLPLERWKVKKDGGDFDSVTGATISPRAVVKAVASAVKYATEHREQLYRQEP